MNEKHGFASIAETLQSWDPFRPCFGNYRGAARLVLSRLDAVRGRFRSLRTVRWSEVDRFVFVCRGNICRSAYSEHKAKALGLPSASFGLRCSHGQSANPGAMAAAKGHSVDLTGHRTCAVEHFVPRDGDLLVAVEPGHVAWIERELGRSHNYQLTLLGLWSRPQRPHIHDPYGLDGEYFDKCFSVIDSALATLATQYRRAKI